MAQNAGPFLASPHVPPGFNARLPTSTSSPLLKRTTNGPVSIGNPPNTSMGSNMNVPPSSMRSSNSMGTLKSSSISMNPMDKSNPMPYSSRYTRKAWPMSRNINDKNMRGYDEHEPPYMRPNQPTHSIPPDTINSSSFTIEPAADDDEGDDTIFSARHMAAARFQRNQRLLHEICNEVCIPDLRSNISVDRILTLRRQVNALKTHRETFEKDLNELEEKHAEKKRRFLETNEKFHNEYADASRTNLSDEKTNEILQKHEAMEKLQKEKQLLALQQQQQTVTPSTQLQPPPPPPPPPPPLPSTVVSQPMAPPITKTEPIATVEIPQQTTSTPPPPSVQTQSQSSPSIPPVQSVSASPSVPSQLPSSQSVSNQLPPLQTVQSQTPPTQTVSPQLASPQLPPAMLQTPPPPPPVMSQVPQQPSHPISQVPQLPPPAMVQIPPQQHQPPTSASQGYPMIHPGGGGYPPGYGHAPPTQYRPQMSQRSAQYPSNVQWQQQQQQQHPPPQQQWQPNAYDSRYYSPYPPNVQQWSQQQPPPQQQWPSNQPQQPSTQMRGPPHPQQAQMYPNGVHYGYGGAVAGWNPNTHPSQAYGYPQNPSYDPSLVSGPPPPPQQQQYYQPPPPQMHNPPQGYDYGPPPPQQQMPPQ
ncbi:unnamed protein product [Rotaria magnacalcarata]